MPGGEQPHPRWLPQSAARLLETLGHHVAEAKLAPLDEPSVPEVMPIIFGSAVARDVQRWSAALGHDIAGELEPPNRVLPQQS